MPKNVLFNGAQLKKARVYRGYTVAELAELTGYQRQTISMYESGKSTPIDLSVVNKLSVVLNFPSKFFTDKSDMTTKGTTYFRALLTTNKKYRCQQEQKMEFVSEIYSFLKEYIDFPQMNLPKDTGLMTPEEAANALRNAWGLGNRPIDNLIYTVESNGIIVTTFETDTDDVDAFSTVTYIDDEPIYLIGYSSNKTSAARIHFDIAHELGHICLHGWSEDIETISKEEFREREEQANRFAAAFLLPKESFANDVRLGSMSLPYYKQLKQKWKTSMAAMIRKAWNLGIITYEDYQSLMRTMQRRGYRKFEPLDDSLITASPSLLRTAVSMLLSEKVFTPKEFVDELSYNYGVSLYPAEIEYLLNLPQNTLYYSNVLQFSQLTLKKDGEQ